MANSEAKDNTEWEEIMGKDLAVKRIRNGSGDLAEMGTVVTCNLRGFFVENGEVSTNAFEEWKNQTFKVGEADAIPGIEMALRFSRVGDLLRVRCNSRFGYGTVGRPVVIARNNVENKQENVGDFSNDSIEAIPADRDLEYELDILAHLSDGEIDPALLANHPFDEPSRPVTTDEGATSHSDVRDAAMRGHLERLQALTELKQRKEAGNRWFSFADFSRSARAYSKATQIADRYFNGNANSNTPQQALQGVTGEGGTGEAEAALAAAEKAKEAQRRTFQPGDEEVVAVYVSCLNNMAACQLHLGDNAKVKDICIRVLEIDPANHKALLRAAKAALATHDFEECEVVLQRLLDVAPAGSSAALAATTERRRLKQALLEYKQQTKKMSDNMAKQLFKSASSDSGGVGPKKEGAKAERDKQGERKLEETPTTNKSDPSSSETGAAPAGSMRSGAAATEASAPAAAVPTTAPASSAVAASADRGLLLLLLTSLAVLLVSVFLVVWTAKSK